MSQFNLHFVEPIWSVQYISAYLNACIDIIFLYNILKKKNNNIKQQWYYNWSVIHVREKTWV